MSMIISRVASFTQRSGDVLLGVLVQYCQLCFADASDRTYETGLEVGEFIHN